MKNFTLGALSGISALALAVPVFAQVASSDATFSVSIEDEANRPVPTQACLLAMAELEDMQLANFDTMMAKQKQSMQTRSETLRTIAEISDETARKAALTQMHEDMRAAMEAEMDSAKNDDKEAAMTALQEACGGEGGFGMKAMRVMKFDGGEVRKGGHFKAGTFMGARGGHRMFTAPVNAEEVETIEIE